MIVSAENDENGDVSPASVSSDSDSDASTTDFATPANTPRSPRRIALQTALMEEIEASAVSDPSSTPTESSPRISTGIPTPRVSQVSSSPRPRSNSDSDSSRHDDHDNVELETSPFGPLETTATTTAAETKRPCCSCSGLCGIVLRLFGCYRQPTPEICKRVGSFIATAIVFVAITLFIIIRISEFVGLGPTGLNISQMARHSLTWVLVVVGIVLYLATKNMAVLFIFVSVAVYTNQIGGFVIKGFQLAPDHVGYPAAVLVGGMATMSAFVRTLSLVVFILHVAFIFISILVIWVLDAGIQATGSSFASYAIENLLDLVASALPGFMASGIVLWLVASINSYTRQLEDLAKGVSKLDLHRKGIDKLLKKKEYACTTLELLFQTIIRNNLYRSYLPPSLYCGNDSPGTDDDDEKLSLISENSDLVSLESPRTHGKHGMEEGGGSEHARKGSDTSESCPSTSRDSATSDCASMQLPIAERRSRSSRSRTRPLDLVRTGGEVGNFIIREFSVVSVAILNAHEFMRDQALLSHLSTVHASVIEACTVVAHKHKGLVDEFSHDVVVLVFNGAKRLVSHAEAACMAALAIRGLFETIKSRCRAPARRCSPASSSSSLGEMGQFLKYPEPSFAISVVTSEGCCGVMGTKQVKRFRHISPAFSLGRSFAKRVANDGSIVACARTRSIAKYLFSFRPFDVLLSRLEVPEDFVLSAPRSLPRFLPSTPESGCLLGVYSLLCEENYRVGEWMYEIRDRLVDVKTKPERALQEAMDVILRSDDWQGALVALASVLEEGDEKTIAPDKSVVVVREAARRFLDTVSIGRPQYVIDPAD